MRDIALFSRQIYTAGTNFTRPPVVTVATNLNSDKGIGTLYTNTKRTKQSLDFFFRDKGKGDHVASTTSNFKLHGFQTLLTGVFKRTVDPL